MAAAEWRVLIADDEPAARRGVRQLLAAFPDYSVVGECRDGAEVLARIDSLRPHLVFLDVQMPGIDGFEVIRRRTPDRMPVVVFLTAYDQFAIRAFEAQAFDYLVKPVSEARFAAAIKRVGRHLKLVASSAADSAVLVTTPRGAIVVPAAEIEWIESAGNYARIWTGQRSHLVREPLRLLEPRVRPAGFIRAHRRALVRLAAVREMGTRPDGGSTAVLQSGTRIPVSRRRRRAFLAAMRALRQ